jgi:hypothetical protein
VETYVIDWARHAIPPYYDRAKMAEAGKKLPFADPLSVSAYVYPVVTMSAKSANAFGSVIPGGAEVLNLAKSKQVSIGFENTVKFGMNDNVRVPEDRYKSDLADIINKANLCHWLVGPDGIRIPTTPAIRIVNGIVYSDAITFSYEADRFYAAAAGAGTTVAGQGPSLNLNINVPTSAAAVDAQAMQKMVSGKSTASTVAVEGNTIKISRPTSGYVAIAYSYFDISSEQIRRYCNQNTHPEIQKPNERDLPDKPTKSKRNFVYGSYRYYFDDRDVFTAMVNISTGERYSCSGQQRDSFACVGVPPQGKQVFLGWDRSSKRLTVKFNSRGEPTVYDAEEAYQ